jgi:hypothetical protein
LNGFLKWCSSHFILNVFLERFSWMVVFTVILNVYLGCLSWMFILYVYVQCFSSLFFLSVYLARLSCVFILEHKLAPLYSSPCSWTPIQTNKLLTFFTPFKTSSIFSLAWALKLVNTCLVSLSLFLNAYQKQMNFVDLFHTL